MMESNELTPQSNVADVLTRWPQLAPIFVRYRMSCVGCTMSTFETLQGAANIYGVDFGPFYTEIKAMIEQSPSTETGETVPSTGEPETRGSNQPTQEQTMELPYTYIPVIDETVSSIPQDSIVSRTVLRDGKFKAIVFAFAPGQELSEHTASVPAVIHILEGECDLTVGAEHYSAGPGAWVHMQANLAHSIAARTPVKMLLLMLPG